MRSRKKAEQTSHQEFSELLRPHLSALYRTAFRFTGQSQDAEDLLQTVLLKLCNHLDTLRELDAPRSWITRVMYRQFIDDTRWRRRQAPHLSIQQDPSLSDGAPMESFLADTNMGPQDTAHQDQFLDQLGQALARLEADHRALITLHDMEGHTMNELAEMLELPLGTVKSRLHRARARLRALMPMEPSETEPSDTRQRVISQEAQNL